MDRKAKLKAVEQSLLGVIGAITQTPNAKVKKARLASNIATAKVTGIATSASIFGLVSTLGTAGTGTAIGTLSGAAATNATLAWIGGLVGGGMAAGALLLPAAGIAAGTTATMVLKRKIHGRPRKLDELLPFEDEILFCADNLIRPLDAVLADGTPIPTDDELRIYAHDGLKALIIKINEHLQNQDDNITVQDGNLFGATIKPKYQKQLRRHSNILAKYVSEFTKPIKPSFKKKIVALWNRTWLKIRKKPKAKTRNSHLSSVVIAVTFQRLLEEKLLSMSLEQSLVLDALRRSTKRLENSSVEELSEYVKSLSPQQLKGVVSNTKGIYHELLYVEMHNSDATDISAQIMESTNFPGADVQFFMDGEVIREVQLKAISSPTLVYEHLQRYPDIEILVTEEVASVLEGINSSGLNNAILSKDVTERMYELQGEGLFEEISDSLVTSAFVTSGIVVFRVIRNKNIKTTDFKPYLANAGIAAGTATMVEGVMAVIGN